MSGVSESQRQRRLRSEARRSIGAILDAAISVLGERPEASIGDIATVAGVTRQTVYAHYGSREALVNAAIDRVTDDAVAAIDEADLDHGSAREALLRLLEAGWRTFLRHSLLLRMASTDPQADHDRHQPVRAHLEQLIERGQDTGEFTSHVPPTWLITATVALGHAAGDQVATGHMTPDQANSALRHSILRLFEPHDKSA